MLATHVMFYLLKIGLALVYNNMCEMIYKSIRTIIYHADLCKFKLAQVYRDLFSYHKITRSMRVILCMSNLAQV